MKIKPNDPWYPCPFEIRTPVDREEGIVKIAPGWHPGVTIRLKLAAEILKSPAWLAVCGGAEQAKSIGIDELFGLAFRDADAMITRANRDEGSDDGK